MQFHTDSNGRSVDGPYAKNLYIDVPLQTLREVVSNAIPNIAANGGLLASDTTPILQLTNGDTDSALRLTWASSNSDAVIFQAALPGDLDTNQPIYVDIYADSAGSTDTPTFALDTYFDIGDTKVEDTSDAVGASPAVVTATIAASDIPNEDFLTMTCEITPGAHTTDALYVYGIRLRGTRL